MDVLPSYRLTITSIGEASALAAKVIAEGLGSPADRVAEKLYRAPSILADSLSLEVCERLAEMIRGLGIEANVESSQAPPPPPNELFDICVHLTDIAQLPKVSEDLALFLGMDTSTMISLLITPPAMVIGGVSDATYQAIKSRLNFPGVHVIASRPTTAKYDIYLESLTSQQLHPFKRFLQRLKLTMTDSVLADLDYDTAQSIWKQFGHCLPMQVINQAFYRYDLCLVSLPGSLSVSDQPSAQDYLDQTLGMSPMDYSSVEPHLPLVIAEGLSNQEALQQQTEFSSHNLVTSIVNVTLQRLKIEITEAPALPPIQTLLQQLGLLDSPIKSLPYVTRDTSETYARFAKHVLEWSGAQVSYKQCQ
ncbi:MAG: hypothetical protein EA373_11520 [Oceanospirillales bacterium]|nr:MAG: hypothetical protein EA373_11520 [Oceanospirillales bacterium]